MNFVEFMRSFPVTPSLQTAFDRGLHICVKLLNYDSQERNVCSHSKWVPSTVFKENPTEEREIHKLSRSVDNSRAEYAHPDGFYGFHR